LERQRDAFQNQLGKINQRLGDLSAQVTEED
jgi:hypothetical protein